MKRTRRDDCQCGANWQTKPKSDPVQIQLAPEFGTANEMRACSLAELRQQEFRAASDQAIKVLSFPCLTASPQPAPERACSKPGLSFMTNIKTPVRAVDHAGHMDASTVRIVP